MAESDHRELDLVREATAVREARAERILRLSPAERIERLHALCAQFAAVAGVARDGRS